ncbi:MAG: hypothetical protein U0840_18210 [Gemmataceae bacterium]
MKRIAVMVCAVVGLALSSGTCEAGWGHLFYSGYQPWWNIFAKRYKCLTPEEERLQKFWHDYYHALKEFYCHLDAIDWVAYYKNHGYQINGNCGGPGGGPCGRINYAPVFVTPTLQWAVPAGSAGGPPVGPPYAMGGGYPMGYHPAMGGMPPFPPGGPMAGPMGGPMAGPLGGPINAPVAGPLPGNGGNALPPGAGNLPPANGPLGAGAPGN